MNTTIDSDEDLDILLAGPLLDVPDHFAAQVMASLPARSLRTAPNPSASRCWRVLQNFALAVCGALGMAEVTLFICGLWTATAVGIG
jgi:hypothetical protein